MSDNATGLSQGLLMRPSRPSDADFLAALHRSTRADLWMVDAERDFIETLIEQQQKFQTIGYGDAYPNALYFVIERLGERVGRVAIDFDYDEVRILDIAFIPAVHGLGYGTAILRDLQGIATRVGAPLTLSVMRGNGRAAQFYLALGFKVAQRLPLVDVMVWLPWEAGGTGVPPARSGASSEFSG
ncbi:MAG: GNAT family N-acetyltransferase [Alphaproteobacteria bacterium]